MFEISNLCGICCNGLQDAVVLAHCGHHFCKACLLSWESTGLKVCPECHMKLKRPAEVGGLENAEFERSPTARGYGSASKVQLPLPTFSAPHADLVVLYHSRDDVTSANYRDDLPCDLACYVDCLNCRRFYYCDNCETSFHRLEYQEATSKTHTGRQGGLATPLSSLMKNPLSRAGVNLEAQEKYRAVMSLHEQLLGHALYCTLSVCGHRNCALMKKYILPVTRPRRRYRLGGADLSGHTTTSTTTAAAAAAAAAQADSSVFIYTPAAAASTTGTASAASATPASSSMSIISSISRDDSSGKATAREIAERAAERTEQIENCVGLSKGCRLCIRTANILAKHVEVCGVAACSVPYCSNLKQLRAQSHRTHSKLA